MTSCGIPREPSSVETLAESPASVGIYYTVPNIDGTLLDGTVASPRSWNRTWTCDSDAWLAETEPTNAHTVVVQVCKGLNLPSWGP